jgi:hypothetical protein
MNNDLGEDEWAYSDKPPRNPIWDVESAVNDSTKEIERVKREIEQLDQRNDVRMNELVQYINSGPELVLRKIEDRLKVIQWTLIAIFAIVLVKHI